jgi:hypothetical protein
VAWAPRQDRGAWSCSSANRCQTCAIRCASSPSTLAPGADTFTRHDRRPFYPPTERFAQFRILHEPGEPTHPRAYATHSSSPTMVVLPFCYVAGGPRRSPSHRPTGAVLLPMMRNNVAVCKLLTIRPKGLPSDCFGTSVNASSADQAAEDDGAVAERAAETP